jgi:uncharacterized protein
MHPLILEKRSQIEQLCKRFGVVRLELFGSAATGDYEENKSDFDFLVDFKLSGGIKALDACFGLKEELEELLGRPVDLVMPSALRNPFIRAQVDHQRHPVYEA